MTSRNWIATCSHIDPGLITAGAEKKAHVVADEDPFSGVDLAVGATGHDLKEVAIGTDVGIGQPPNLLTGQFAVVKQVGWHLILLPVDPDR